MRNRRPGVDAGELDDSASARFLTSVADDFAALTAVFERQLQAIPQSDAQIRSHVLKAKAAAERGLQLSQELLQRVESAAIAKSS